jgi:hypothetical protein
MSITRSAIERPKNRCVTMTWRHRRERDLVYLDDIGLAVALEHLAFAARGHAIKSRPIMILVIHPHIVLGDADQAAGGIVPLIALLLRAFLDGIAGLRLDRIRNPMGRQAPDLLAVVALRDQPGFRPQHVVKAIIRVADRARVAGDPELLGRHAFHARALTGARAPHGDVVEERMANSE